MSRAILLAAAVLSLAGVGCGSSGDITGSECELIGCGYSERVCEFFDPPYDGYRLTYSKQDPGDVAVLIIDLAGLDDPGDVALSGDDFISRVDLHRTSADQHWPDCDDGSLTISQGELEEGARLKGKAGFMFENGYVASIKFSCKLVDADTD